MVIETCQSGQKVGEIVGNCNLEKVNQLYRYIDFKRTAVQSCEMKYIALCTLHKFLINECMNQFENVYGLIY